MMKRGIVVATHPGDHSVDLVLTDTGQRLVGVQVLSPNGSTRSGTVDMPAVPERSNKWDITQETGQDIHAVVGFIGSMPVVTGFIYPQISQMTFDDPKLRVQRHQSDVYSTIDGDGNIQLRHPSGFYLRIGETPDFSAPVNADKSLAIDRNTSRNVYLRLELAGNVAKLTMTPQGECTLELDQSFNLLAKEDIKFKADGNIEMEAGGSVSVKAGSAINTESGGNTTIKAPTTNLDSNANVSGNTSINGSTSVKAITSNGKNISDSHFHLNSGGPATGGPVGG